MHLSRLMIFTSFAMFGYASIKEPKCESIPFSTDGYLYVTCRGNFTEMDKLKLLLENVTEPITVFKLQDTILDVLPPDVFHNVAKPRIQKVIFDNASMELLTVPELGDPPLKSIKDTVDSIEIYNCSKVFAWNFPLLGFKNLQSIIIEDSELISVTVPFFFWPELRFIQIQNCSVQWLHVNAFEGNKKLTIFSLAHNKITHITRKIFPKPAAYLFSLDLSFNKLEEFSNDMFSEMEALQELKIDNNRLKFLNQIHLKPVWNNLKMLWLDGNQVPCDSLCWMIERTEMPLFLESSTCKLLDKLLLIDEYRQTCKLHNQYRQSANYKNDFLEET